jgi:type II secretion system protein G
LTRSSDWTDAPFNPPKERNEAVRARVGFTLIELLIVVAIIAILAAIAVPNFLEAQVRSKVARVSTDIRAIVTALETYHVDNNKYPPSINPQTSSTYVPRVRSYKPLTTPVAYLTSGVQDVFNTNEGVPAGFSARDQHVLVYWSSDFLVRYAPNGIDGSPNFDQTPRTALILQNYPQYVAQGGSNRYIGPDKLYLVLSYGPDQAFDVNKLPGFPQPIQPYDPSNGTISDGDVVRFRGD